jgi:hypothetical protein
MKQDEDVTVPVWTPASRDLDKMWDEWRVSQGLTWHVYLIQEEWDAFVALVYTQRQYSRLDIIVWKSLRWHRDNRRGITTQMRSDHDATPDNIPFAGEEQ